MLDKHLQNNSSLTFIKLKLIVFSIYRNKLSPDFSSLCVLLVQMVSTTGMTLRDDIMTRSHRSCLPSCRWAGPEVKLRQVIKGGHNGGKYDKCSSLHACPKHSSPRHQIPDCKCFLGHSSSCTPPKFQQIRRIKLNSTGLQGHDSQFPLRLSAPVTPHFTGVDGFWQMSKCCITKIHNVSVSPAPLLPRCPDVPHSPTFTHNSEKF